MSTTHRQRVLALDVGERRIGVAISDELGTLARPLEIIDRRRINAYDRLAEIVSFHQVSKILVGLPKNMDGSEGRQARLTREFVRQLEAVLPGVEFQFWDERLTTRQARGLSLETRSRKQRQQEALDALSACFILQSFLDSQSPRDTGQLPGEAL